MDTIFSQANISTEQGVEIMQALGLDALSIQSPDTFRKYLYIAKYLEKFGDAPAIVRTVARSASLKDKLDKVYEYIA